MIKRQAFLILSAISLLTGGLSVYAQEIPEVVTADVASDSLGVEYADFLDRVQRADRPQGPVEAFPIELKPSVLSDGRAVRISVPLDPDRGPLKSVKFGRKEVPMMPIYDQASAALLGWEGYAGIPHEADRTDAEQGTIRLTVTYLDKYLELSVFEREVILDFDVATSDFRREDINSDAKFSADDEATKARKDSDSAAVGKAYGASRKTFEKKWTGPWRYPVELETFKITSRFGTRRFHRGEPSGYHSGADLRAYSGHPIYAPAGGRVELAQDLLMTGNTIIINHGYGVSTLYAHLSRFKVKVGATVQPGDLIGLSGATGRVGKDKNGVPQAHLHWMLILQGVKVDPIEGMKLFR